LPAVRLTVFLLLSFNIPKKGVAFLAPPALLFLSPAHWRQEKTFQG
jgi:hypothetical protein